MSHFSLCRAVVSVHGPCGRQKPRSVGSQQVIRSTQGGGQWAEDRGRGRRTAECLETNSLQEHSSSAPTLVPASYNSPSMSSPLAFKLLTGSEFKILPLLFPKWRFGKMVLARGGGNVFITGNKQHDCILINQHRFQNSTGACGLRGPWNSI